MGTDPDWWRGQQPPNDPPTEWTSSDREYITGRQTDTLAVPEPGSTGLRRLTFFRAEVREQELWLNDAHLTVSWSEFVDCHFRQRVRPVTNEHGLAAQGSWGSGPSVYRGCTFERIRFKTLGGFTMSRARFEDCTFVNCRWEGHFAHDADLVSCVFKGPMNGCVWFGHGRDADGTERANVLRANDFTQTHFTDNVGWRRGFPIADQAWPVDFTPRVDVP